MSTLATILSKGHTLQGKEGLVLLRRLKIFSSHVYSLARFDPSVDTLSLTPNELGTRFADLCGEDIGPLDGFLELADKEDNIANRRLACHLAILLANERGHSKEQALLQVNEAGPKPGPSSQPDHQQQNEASEQTSGPSTQPDHQQENEASEQTSGPSTQPDQQQENEASEQTSGPSTQPDHQQENEASEQTSGPSTQPDHQQQNEASEQTSGPSTQPDHQQENEASEQTSGPSTQPDHQQENEASEQTLGPSTQPDQQQDSEATEQTSGPSTQPDHQQENESSEQTSGPSTQPDQQQESEATEQTSGPSTQPDHQQEIEASEQTSGPSTQPDHQQENEAPEQTSGPSTQPDHQQENEASEQTSVPKTKSDHQQESEASEQTSVPKTQSDHQQESEASEQISVPNTQPDQRQESKASEQTSGPSTQPDHQQESEAPEQTSGPSTQPDHQQENEASEQTSVPKTKSDHQQESEASEQTSVPKTQSDHQQESEASEQISVPNTQPDQRQESKASEQTSGPSTQPDQQQESEASEQTSGPSTQPDHQQESEASEQTSGPSTQPDHQQDSQASASTKTRLEQTSDLAESVLTTRLSKLDSTVKVQRKKRRRRNMAKPPINVTGVTGGNVGTANVAAIVHGGMGNTYVADNRQMELNDLSERTKDEIKVKTENMIRVSAVDFVIEKMKTGQHWITITGNAGDGKTTLGYLVLKEFLQKNVKVFTIDKPEEYDLISKMKEESVIMLDDRFGAFGADRQEIGKWFDVIKKLSSEKDENKTKVIFVSRTNVVKEAKAYLGHLTDKLFDKEPMIDLSERKVIKERRAIMDYHLRHAGITINDAIKERVCNMEVAHGFPHCCKMFSKFESKGYNVAIEEFFESPLKFLDLSTKVLYNDNCKKLFQLMIKNDGELDIYAIQDDDERQALFKVEREQEGSYITEWKNGICTFAHPSVYESVLNVINDIDPVYCVKYANLSLILQKMLISTSDEEDESKSPCYIMLKPIPAVMNVLAERFRGDIIKGNYSVFKHRFCKSRSFCEALVCCCVDTHDKKSSSRVSDDNESGNGAVDQETVWTVKGQFDKYNSKAAKETPQNRSKQHINEPGMNGKTMLWTALKRGNMTAVCTLVRNKADVNIQHRCERTPLHHLVYDGYTYYFWGEDEDGDAYDEWDEDDENTFCHDKISVADTIRVIITEGKGDVNIRDEDGKTPLHYLCHNSRVNIDAIRMIITEGKGDVNIRDEDGKTPLHYITQKKGPAADANADQPLINIDAIRMIITDGGGDVTICDRSGRSSLHYLLDHQTIHAEAIKFLVSAWKGDFNLGDINGRTPLHCFSRHTDVNSDLLKLMITKGGNVNQPDVYGSTSLHYFCRRRNISLDLLKLMVSEGDGDLNQCEQNKSTPLHYLCAYSGLQLDTLDLVVSKGDFNKGDEHGTTALHFICKQMNVGYDIVHRIVSKGKGNINKQDNNGVTPLHLCSGDVTHIRTLISQGGGDISLADTFGNTLLHYLCRRQRTIVGDLGDLNKQNSLGYTPLDYYVDQDLKRCTVQDYHVCAECNRVNNTSYKRLPWTDGRIERSAADLLLKDGDKRIVALAPAMTLSSERVHPSLQVEDFSMELNNMEPSGDRDRPGQFSWFLGTCSSPLPVPPSPSPFSLPTYLETHSRHTWRKRVGDPLLQMGVVEGEDHLDEEYYVSDLPGSVCVSVDGRCPRHDGRPCIKVWRGDQEDGGDQVGECVTLPLPTPGEDIDFKFGLVLDVGRGRVGFIDVERGEILGKVIYNFTERVFPMFYVIPGTDCPTRMRLVSGREISVTDRKIDLIQQVLSG